MSRNMYLSDWGQNASLLLFQKERHTAPSDNSGARDPPPWHHYQLYLSHFERKNAAVLTWFQPGHCLVGLLSSRLTGG